MEGEGDLEAQLACKEKEWKELQARGIQQLEGALRDTRAQLSAQKERFQQLKEDFQFNLRVLEERDRELERYDAMAARLQTTESTRQVESSELRIQIDKLQEAVAAEARKREEVQIQYQQRLTEHRLQLERMQSMKDCDIQRQRGEYETLKRELERKIQEVEGELVLQKQELMAEFDNEMQRREHEFNLRADEMSNTVLSHELKVMLLSKELEAHTQAHCKASEALRVSEELCRDAHKEIQRSEWEVKDVTAVKDARIKDLEDKLSAMEASREKEEEMYNRKHEELDRCAREREAAIGGLREAHGEQLRRAESRSRELQASLDAALAEKRRMEWSHADALREKDDELERLRAELEMTRSAWDTHIAQVSKDTVSKDVELHALGEREAKLRGELQRCQGDVERYKQQLASGVQREQVLEQARAQAELDWQRRYEDAQAGHYLRSEELIQGLTQARDQATAEVRERERQLQEAATLLRSVTLERDQALHGAAGPPATDTQQAPRAESSGGFPSEEIQRLQQQNSGLRAAIADMRKDMESLSEQLPPAPAGPPAHSAPQHRPAGIPEYSQALEEEVGELKARCRRLENQLEEASKAPAPARGSVPVLPINPDNAYLQNHTRSLNETIGGLRVEKVARTAALKKQEVRLAHLESALSQLTQQIHSKQVECDELRFELANQKKRGAAEEGGLRQRLAAVEMELDEVKREAEEYQRGSLLQNLEAVALGNQVSALKLDIASGREPIVVEQGAVLRQLQDENLRLRQQLLGGDCGDGRASAPLLRSKLKKAARCIAQLSQDKQQLIEMGNRLRARLTEAGWHDMQRPCPAPDSSVTECSSSEDQLQSRLSALEQMQYRLTKKELQYAQLDPRKKITVRSRFSEKEPTKSDRPVNPWDPCGESGYTRELHTRGKKENTPPETSQSQAAEQLELGQPSSGLGHPSSSPPALMSSVCTDSSLRDIWQMLERGSNLSVLTASNSPDRGGERESTRGVNRDSGDQGPGGQVRVQGTKVTVQERRPVKPRAGSAKKPGAPGKTSKIRNYNVKD